LLTRDDFACTLSGQVERMRAEDCGIPTGKGQIYKCHSAALTTSSVNPFFQSQERMLFRHAASVAGERAIRTDDAVTRYDDTNRVSACGRAHRARTARTASAPCKFCIG